MLGRTSFLLSLAIIAGVTAFFCCSQDDSTTSSGGSDSGAAAESTLSSQEQRAKKLLYDACIETKSRDVERVYNLCKQIRSQQSVLRCWVL